MDPATTPLLSLLLIPLRFFFLPLTTLLSFLYTTARAALLFPRALIHVAEPIWVFCGIALIVGTCVGASVAVVGWALGIVLGTGDTRGNMGAQQRAHAAAAGEFDGWDDSEWEGSVDGMAEMREWEVMEAEEDRDGGRRRRRGR